VGASGGDGERPTLAIYGQRGCGFVECERRRMKIASLLERFSVDFFYFLASLTNLARLLELL
jgi:hypothetical protein